MKKHRGKEIRQSETHEQVWVKENMQIYVYSDNKMRELPHEEDDNHDRIVKCILFKGGWCYVEQLMSECWEEKHKYNLKKRVYNNMKKKTKDGWVHGGGHIHIFNSASLCEEFKITTTELEYIVINALQRKPTPESKKRMDAVKGSVKREKAAKARKEIMAEEQEIGIKLLKTYVPYDSVPPINLGIKPKAHDDEDNLEEE